MKWIVCVDCATVQASLTLSWPEVLLGSQFILFFKETLKSDTLKLICCIFYFTEFYFQLPLFCSHFSSVLRVPLFQTEYQVSTALCMCVLMKNHCYSLATKRAILLLFLQFNIWIGRWVEKTLPRAGLCNILIPLTPSTRL